MKIWVTTYALTTGIFSIDAEITPSGRMAKWVIGGSLKFAHGQGKDWHYSEEEAKARARAMRVAKINLLCNELDRLEALEF